MFAHNTLDYYLTYKTNAIITKNTKLEEPSHAKNTHTKFTAYFASRITF